MKTIGLLGGMSWESTLGYYRAINEGVKNTLGGLHSAKIAMYSVDLGKIESDSKAAYLRIIDTLAARGAEAVILGCTEIGMLINQADTDVRLFDTTAIHARKAVEYATAS